MSAYHFSTVTHMVTADLGCVITNDCMTTYDYIQHTVTCITYDYTIAFDYMMAYDSTIANNCV